MIEKMQDQFTRYEIARILGARALQLAMDAPVLLKISEEKLEEINYDVLKLAEFEFEEGVLPITVKRPFPKKTEEKIKKISKEEAEEIEKKKEEKKEEEEKREAAEDKKIGEKEKIEEAKIKEEGEIMALARPGDEVEEETKREEEGI
jgi:DNA-directed RNA polymerase subunit K